MAIDDMKSVTAKATMKPYPCRLFLFLQNPSLYTTVPFPNVPRKNMMEYMKHRATFAKVEITQPPEVSSVVSAFASVVLFDEIIVSSDSKKVVPCFYRIQNWSRNTCLEGIWLILLYTVFIISENVKEVL